VWVGGLVALVAVVLGRVTADARAFRSFSAIALWSATVVAVTGISQLLLRVTDANELFTSAYGLIMVAKMQLLALLLAIGWVQRSRTLPMLEMGNRRPLVALAGLEALIMAAVVGLSDTLSRTAAASPVADGLTSGRSHALPPVPLNRSTSCPNGALTSSPSSLRHCLLPRMPRDCMRCTAAVRGGRPGGQSVSHAESRRCS
jgi:hypothetical protein